MRIVPVAPSSSVDPAHKPQPAPKSPGSTPVADKVTISPAAAKILGGDVDHDGDSK